MHRVRLPAGRLPVREHRSVKSPDHVLHYLRRRRLVHRSIIARFIKHAIERVRRRRAILPCVKIIRARLCQILIGSPERAFIIARLHRAPSRSRVAVAHARDPSYECASVIGATSAEAAVHDVRFVSFLSTHLRRNRVRRHDVPCAGARVALARVQRTHAHGDEDFIVFRVTFGGGHGGAPRVSKCGTGHERAFRYDVE